VPTLTRGPALHARHVAGCLLTQETRVEGPVERERARRVTVTAALQLRIVVEDLGRAFDDVASPALYARGVSLSRSATKRARHRMPLPHISGSVPACCRRPRGRRQWTKANRVSGLGGAVIKLEILGAAAISEA
jgi:hypothetical protein